mmetsp:Transcript_15780/g.25187  ORF Transcript_15780/g.25187 Transcript_15780/m.25187 type:complete len:84 (+) Transcript_15780:57-308(+)
MPLCVKAARPLSVAVPKLKKNRAGYWMDSAEDVSQLASLLCESKTINQLFYIDWKTNRSLWSNIFPSPMLLTWAGPKITFTRG